MKKDSDIYSIGIVISNRHLKGDYYLIKIEIPLLTVEPKPGQFYQIKPLTVNITGEYKGSLLFKPLSVYNYNDDIITFMIKAVGEGTREMAKLVAEDKVALIGPLGRGFEYDNLIKNNNQATAFLISGGIGYAPLFYLKKELRANNIRTLWFHGGRSRIDVFPADIIYTDDGSKGGKGFITEGIHSVLQEYKDNEMNQIFCCGPRMMMRSIADYSSYHNIPAQLSLEEYMACGIGACLGCAVKAAVNPNDDEASSNRKKYLMVCKDGPVFKREEIDLNE